MSRALVCTVGGNLQPIVNAIRDDAPLDHVYFLCSADGSDRTIAEVTTYDVKGHCPYCHRDFKTQGSLRPVAETAALSSESYSIEAIDDPDELLEAVAACDRIRADLDQRWPEGRVEVLANYSGGTKTMSLALALYALKEGWTLKLNKGPRGDLVRVETGDVAVAQDVSRLLAETAVERAEELFERHDYEGATAVLSVALTRQPLRGPDQQRLLRLRLRYEMWAAWDRFDYRRALELAQARRHQEHSGRLRLLIRVVDVLEGKESWPGGKFPALALVDDLRGSADRAALRGRYDDAVGRLYRATELLAQIRLRSEFGLDTGGVSLDNPNLLHAARQRLETRHRSGDQVDTPTTVKIGLMEAYQLLADLGDPVGHYFEEGRGVLQGLIEKRNQSLFAHGLVPIDEQVWADIGPKWRAWLDGAQREAEG